MEKGDIARVSEHALSNGFGDHNKAAVAAHGWLWVILPRDGYTIPARSLATGAIKNWLPYELEQANEEG